MGEEPLADPMAGAALSEVARTFQEALVPPIAPSIGGLDCLSRYRPGDRRMLVGGDFMDVIEAPQGGVAWVVGDVAGHGPVAAAMGVGLRASWRTVVCGRSEPDEWLDRMEAVFESLPRSSELFVTLCTGLIAPDLASAVVLSAGHPPPILLLDAARPVEVKPALPLGVHEGSREWAVVHVTLGARWALLAYTDGLIEGRRAPGASQRYGVESLTAWLDGADPAGIGAAEVDELIRDIESANGGAVDDDVAVLLLSCGARRSRR